MITALRTTVYGITALLALAAAAQPASAVAIDVTSTAPTWSFTGGTNTNTGTQGAGNATVWQIRWGTSTGSGQSGLGFDPAQPPTLSTSPDTLFNLGTLFHYNNPINGDVPTSITLTLSTAIAGAIPATLPFAFGFAVDETPNSGPVGSCPYPSTVPCSDKITFTNIDTMNVFTLGGNPYTMELVGFSFDGGTTFTNQFISNEGTTNQAALYAKFTAPHSTVPEPHSFLVLATALLGLGWVARARKA